MRHGSLFSGIGGFDLAAEWMGWENVFHCENNEFCQKVLKYHFPNSIGFSDIHNITVDDYGNLLYLCENGDINMGNIKSEKYNNAVHLYEGGMSIQDCAEFFEISRQAMHKILIRRGCKFRDNLKVSDENHFYRGCYGNQAKKKRVQHIVAKAILKGVLIQPVMCSKCGNTQVFKDGRNGIQAHHEDYDKPLEIIWLCQKCHHDWHKNNKAKNADEPDKSKEPTGAVDIISGGFP